MPGIAAKPPPQLVRNAITFGVHKSIQILSLARGSWGIPAGPRKQVPPQLPGPPPLRYPGNSKMANTYSALKRVRQTERRTEFNRKSKSRLRHQIRSMRRALQDKDAKKAGELLPQTFSIIDRAAKTGIIKKNTAGRYKSKLHARVKALA